MNGECLDNNEKIVNRNYKHGELEYNFRLCRKCSLDPDFSGFISETKIQSKEVIQ